MNEATEITAAAKIDTNSAVYTDAIALDEAKELVATVGTHAALLRYWRTIGVEFGDYTDSDCGPCELDGLTLAERVERVRINNGWA